MVLLEGGVGLVEEAHELAAAANELQGAGAGVADELRAEERGEDAEGVAAQRGGRRGPKAGRVHGQAGELREGRGTNDSFYLPDQPADKEGARHARDGDLQQAH